MIDRTIGQRRISLHQHSGEDVRGCMYVYTSPHVCWFLENGGLSQLSLQLDKLQLEHTDSMSSLHAGLSELSAVAQKNAKVF